MQELSKKVSNDSKKFVTKNWCFFGVKWYIFARNSICLEQNMVEMSYLAEIKVKKLSFAKGCVNITVLRIPSYERKQQPKSICEWPNEKTFFIK